MKTHLEIGMNNSIWKSFLFVFFIFQLSIATGNIPLHEWAAIIEASNSTINDKGEREHTTPENLITWIFEDGTFIPIAKLQGYKSYSIITDHLGTPIEYYDEEGKKVWSRELGIYGQTLKEFGEENFIPFLYQGQYLDAETELAYNRFRYYSPESGTYVSQDRLRLSGGLKLYEYSRNSTRIIDPFGLVDLYHGGSAGSISNIKENGVDLSKGRTNVDFNTAGSGAFYTSDSYNDTVKYNRRISGDTDIVKFSVPDEQMADLKIKTFDGPTEEWADFVTKARKGELVHDYDVVIGPKLRNPREVLEEGATPKAIKKQTQIAITSEKGARVLSNNISCH